LLHNIEINAGQSELVLIFNCRRVTFIGIRC